VRERGGPDAPRLTMRREPGHHASFPGGNNVDRSAPPGIGEDAIADARRRAALIFRAPAGGPPAEPRKHSGCRGQPLTVDVWNEGAAMTNRIARCQWNDVNSIGIDPYLRHRRRWSGIVADPQIMRAGYEMDFTDTGLLIESFLAGFSGVGDDRDQVGSVRYRDMPFHRVANRAGAGDELADVTDRDMAPDPHLRGDMPATADNLASQTRCRHSLVTHQASAISLAGLARSRHGNLIRRVDAHSRYGRTQPRGGALVH